MFSSYFTNGVFIDDSSSDHLRVEKAQGLILTVKAGRANINGAFYWQKDDETITLEKSNATKSYNIILRLNDNDDYRNISLVVSDANSEITRNDSIYDLVLATVTVEGNASEIKGTNITDTRLDSSRCGVVTSAIKQIDTTQFLNQFAQAIVETKKENAQAIQENQKLWDDWFAGVKDVLGEGEGGKLLLMIQNLEKEQKELLKTTINNTIDAMFPIGSVYITTTNTNPSTFLKGTWEQFGQGRTLIGEGTGNDGSISMSFTANDTGGSYNHNHIYGIKVNTYYSSNANIKIRKSDGSWQEGTEDGKDYAYFNNSVQASNRNLNTVSYKIESNTSDSNSIQPYIIVYFWRRIA